MLYQLSYGINNAFFKAERKDNFASHFCKSIIKSVSFCWNVIFHLSKSMSKNYFLLYIFCLSVFFSCNSQQKKSKPRIGLLMETLKEERWQHDRDFFVAKAEAIGCEVLVQACNGNDELQLAQAENMITQGVDVLVVVPHNGKIASTIVDNAHKHGVRVIAYDRMIRDCDLDLYVSFDNERIGEMQAEYLVKKAPRGNYILIGGSPTDNNALLYHEGQMKILQPYIDSGFIKIIANQWAADWQPMEAMKHVENALTKEKNINAIVASNDGTASGAIQALHEQQLDGKVLVSGQDAELSACKRVIAGKQSMTVYKPLQLMAEAAAVAALQVIRNELVSGAVKIVSNGKKDIPSILIDPIVVDKTNMMETVIKDGYHSEKEIYNK
ncbi:MAG: D-xylose transporter subunit XylF [Sphingobacteriales bacterium]|nr:MAG: D-xylose transporter subunit XylF [Sphingobacteriales bacterium]